MDRLVQTILSLSNSNAISTKVIELFEENNEISTRLNESCIHLLKSISFEKAYIADVLVDIVVDRVVSKHHLAKNWIGTLKWTVLHGFKLYHDTNLYERWLQKMKNLFTNFKAISRLENATIYAPNVFNVIGAFCCISYIDRFTPLAVRNADIDNQFASVENELVQFAAKCDPTAVLFPLSFIAAHIMDIATGPKEKPRSLKHIMSVNSVVI